MERRIINSFGTITIPSHIRKEVGIDGGVLLWVDVRELKDGTKEIVLRKSDTLEDIVKKYRKWAEVIARIAESAVAIVWNSCLVTLSSDVETQDFSKKGIYVSPELQLSLTKLLGNSAVVRDNVDIPLLKTGMGKVSAYYRIGNTGDDSGFFIIVKGTKYDKNEVSKAEEKRRYVIINDIVDKL
jgi:bifunctional DNA-binding transcriptional regulator/antitoxin component of YhaV-PrlF toxin-antitoxin module